ncbi:ParB/RepB/Spo0J family partition protein [Puniceibacterium confluentis]|uniref:ParB/RepB/Spo0J family partition protein n=1 Tax=Puniceibacterium confluentis TaxID=1958944 RepID=UPI0011B5EC3A|nr:ParB N-terminal domain-containing protein [Puniceibacterium confluentis]
MARRRKLETPSAEALEQLESEFRRETPTRSAMAPIAQVAADAAQSAPVADPATRARQARDTADAETLRAARDKGLVMLELPLAAIATDSLIRDRAVIGEAEMEELRLSIAANGLRLPIEVYELADSEGELRYALLSGYRRLLAVRGLHARTGDPGYATIRAVLRAPRDISDGFIAMVEENEIRANLSHFERGRIAAIAAHNGAFASVSEAVDALFFAASKSKRSKVRSFAQIFEEIGDLLSFPEALTERQGLRLANALRADAGQALRAALAEGQGSDPVGEWAVLERIIATTEEQPRDRARGGRPRAEPKGPARIETSSGVVLRRISDSQGYLIRLEGRRVDADMVDAIMAEIQRLLEP